MCRKASNNCKHHRISLSFFFTFSFSLPLSKHPHTFHTEIPFILAQPKTISFKLLHRHISLRPHTDAIYCINLALNRFSVLRLLFHLCWAGSIELECHLELIFVMKIVGCWFQWKMSTFMWDHISLWIIIAPHAMENCIMIYMRNVNVLVLAILSPSLRSFGWQWPLSLSLDRATFHLWYFVMF